MKVAMSKLPPPVTPPPNEDAKNKIITTPFIKKRVGGKCDTKIELLALRPGGSRKRCFGGDDNWKSEKNNFFDRRESGSDSSESYTFSANSVTKDRDGDDDDILSYNELEDECVRDMKGNCILPMNCI